MKNLTISGGENFKIPFSLPRYLCRCSDLPFLNYTFPTFNAERTNERTDEHVEYKKTQATHGEARETEQSERPAGAW